MFKRVILGALQVLLALVMAGCGAFAPQPQATPLPPEMLGTAIVETQAAIAGTATQTTRPTRTPLPTETPRPTWTPTIVPSVTPTFVLTIPVIGGNTGNTGSNLVPTVSGYSYPYSALPGYQAANGCDLVALSPDWGTVYKPGDNFDAVWTFANYGPSTWQGTDTDFKWVDGEKMYKFGALWDLGTTVYPGERITMVVDMTAPAKEGAYTSLWLLSQGTQFLCQVSVSIVVKK